MADTRQGTHFWFAAFASVTGDRLGTMNFAGAVTPGPGETRLDLYNRIIGHIRAEQPELSSVAVIAFDVQPNAA